MATTAGPEVGSDTALKQRVLSTPEVLAQSVANMAPSAAMALLPLFVFFSAGNALWLSFGLGLVVMLLVGYCAAQFGKRINSAGSFYVWVTRGLGPGAGHAAGWGLVLGYLFTGIACVLGFEIYGDQFLVGLGLSPGNHAVRAILYVVGGLTPALVSVLDIRISQRAAFILEAISVTIILILCIAVYVHKGSVFDHAQLTLKGFKPGGLVVGMVLAIFAFVGFESAGALGQEAKDPERSVPRRHLVELRRGRRVLPDRVVRAAGRLRRGRLRQGQRAAARARQQGRPRPAQPLHRHRHHLQHVRLHAGLPQRGLADAAELRPRRTGPQGAGAHVAEDRGPGLRHLGGGHPDDPDPGHLHRGRQHRHHSHLRDGHAGHLRLHAGLRPGGHRRALFLFRRRESWRLAALLGGLGVLTMAFVFYVSWVPQLIPNDIFAALTWPLWILPYIFLAWAAVGLVWYFMISPDRPEVIAAPAAGARSTSPPPQRSPPTCPPSAPSGRPLTPIAGWPRRALVRSRLSGRR